MGEEEKLLFRLSKAERETIYTGVGLLLASRSIKQSAKDTALEMLRRLNEEEEKHGL